MASIYDNPDLINARNQAQSLSQQAANESQAGMTLADTLKDALTKKFSTDNPLVQQRESSLANYLTAQQAAPLAVTAQSAGGQAPVIYNPQEQAALIAGRRALPTAQLATANTLLGLATGGMGDVIDSASRAHQAYTQGLTQRAQLARQGYTDLLTELSKKAEEAMAQQKLAQDRDMELLKIMSRGGTSELAGGKKLTSGEKNKANLYESGLRQLDQFRNQYQNLPNTGPFQALRTNIFKNILPQFADPTIASFQSDIGPLREQVVNALSGTSVSKEEAGRVMGWIPDASKSSAENERNLNSLKNWLQTNYETVTGINYEPKTGLKTRPPLSSFER